MKIKDFIHFKKCHKESNRLYLFEEKEICSQYALDRMEVVERGDYLKMR